MKTVLQWLRLSNLFVVFSLAGLIYSAANTQFSQAIFFGDSLTDTGNYPESVEHPVPFTNPYHGHAGYYGKTKRVIWPQIVVRELYNQKKLPSTKAMKNYAWGSAITVDYYSNEAGKIIKTCQNPSQKPLCIPGLLKQINLYLAKNNQKADPKALYFLWAGGKDMFNNVDYFLHLKWASMIWSPADNVVQAARLLAKAGARHIIVFNLPNIAYTPALSQKSWLKIPVGYLTKKFNTSLSDGLEHDLKPFNIKPVIIDIAGIFEKIYLKKPPYQNLKHYSLNRMCKDDKKASQNNCPGYLFWDNKHPAWQGSVIIARSVLFKLDKI